MEAVTIQLKYWNIFFIPFSLMCIIRLIPVITVTSLLQTLKLQELAKHKGHSALFNFLVLGHAKCKGVQRVYCNLFPNKMFYHDGSHRMDPVTVIIRPPEVDNGAFIVSPETIWYALVLHLFSASAMTDTATLDPSPSIVPLFQPWKHFMILKMVIIRIIHIIAIICIVVIMHIIAIFSIISD
jgi:hypothetical protein